MEFLIALLIALAVFLALYNLFFRSRLLASQVAKRLDATLAAPDKSLNEIDTNSPEYKLAQAGVRAGAPQLVWFALVWGVPLVVVGVSVALGLPLIISIAAGVLGLFAPRQWLTGRIRDRGRRMDEEIPSAYVRLLSILRASPDVAQSLLEVADGFELEKNSPTLLSEEFRLTASQMNDGRIGREQALRNLQLRAASVSLANLGLLLERFSQTGGDRFYPAFETAAHNVQAILTTRGQAKAKASQQMMTVYFTPVIIGGILLMLMNDPLLGKVVQLPGTQLLIGLAAVLMFIGFNVASAMVKEAV